MSSKEEDPYKYFQNKLKGQGAGQPASDSDSDGEISATSINKMGVASDKFEDEYSMNDEEDFSLSVSMKKPELGKKSAVSTLAKMSAEQKAEMARKKADEEYKRIQA